MWFLFHCQGLYLVGLFGINVLLSWQLTIISVDAVWFAVGNINAAQVGG